MEQSRHIFHLGIKELLSLSRDPVLLFLIVYSFTFSVYTPAKSAVMDVINASVAVVDEDHSKVSRRYLRLCCRRCFCRRLNASARSIA